MQPHVDRVRADPARGARARARRSARSPRGGIPRTAGARRRTRSPRRGRRARCSGRAAAALALPAAELEPARDPALPRSGGGSARLVVQAPAVAVHEPARGIGDELAERRDPVLQRHPGIIANAESPPKRGTIESARLVEKRDVDVPARGRGSDRPQRRGALRLARGVRGVHERRRERADACRPRALRRGGVVARAGSDEAISLRERSYAGFSSSGDQLERRPARAHARPDDHVGRRALRRRSRAGSPSAERLLEGHARCDRALVS